MTSLQATSPGTPPDTPPDISAPIPSQMSAAIDRLGEVCETMFGLALRPNGSPIHLSGADLSYAAAISVVRHNGSWELGLFSGAVSSKNFTRAMLALEDDEDPTDEEIVDAFGEIVNMVSGMVKRSRSEREQSEIQIGVPLFLLGSDCSKMVPRVMEIHAQPMGCSDFEGSLLFVWCERTPAGLLSEIAAELEQGGRDDKLALGRVLSLFDELHEFLADTASSSMAAAIEGCQPLVMDLINEEATAAGSVHQAVTRTIATIRSVLDSDHPHTEITLPSALVSRSLEVAKDTDGSTSPTVVERDDEMLETFQEFLEESEDGLDTVDGVLMRLETSGPDSESINQLFRTFHSIKGVSGFLDINDVTALAHTTETLLSDCRDGRRELAGSALDVVFESTALMRRLLGDVRHAVERNAAFPLRSEVHALITALDAVIAGKDPPPRVAASAPRSAEVKPTEVATTKSKLKPVMKIEVDLVEDLESQLRSLHTLSVALGSAPAAQPVAAQLGELASLVHSLHDTSMRMRLVPVSSMFQKMARMVRDLSKKTEKLTRLVLAGEETKIARSIIDKIGEPLVHMIRNAVDHGIESTDERRASNKPLLGTIRLSAWQDNNSVFIEIRDDGKGLRREAILAKAIEKNLISEGATLDDSQVFQLILAPGFSTAPKVTAISGRGVGMDVVKKNIEAAGGEIEISSTPGAGCSFRLVLPLIPRPVTH